MSTVLARMGGALTRHRSSIMSRVRLERGGLPAQLLDHRRERLGVHPVLAQSDEDGEALLVQAAVQELGDLVRDVQRLLRLVHGDVVHRRFTSNDARR